MYVWSYSEQQLTVLLAEPSHLQMEQSIGRLSTVMVLREEEVETVIHEAFLHKCQFPLTNADTQVNVRL